MENIKKQVGLVNVIIRGHKSSYIVKYDFEYNLRNIADGLIFPNADVYYCDV